MARSFSALVLSLALLFALPGSAMAARTAPESGIQVDPDSAPAHEYALPLDAARGVGAGSPPSDASGVPARPPAFGAGITRKAAGASEPPGSRDVAGRSGARGGGSATNGAAETGPAAAARGAARADHGGATGEASESGATVVLYSLGAAIVVLGGGGLLALTLRRRQPSM